MKYSAKSGAGAGSDLLRRLGGSAPLLGVLSPQLMLAKKLEPPTFLWKKKMGGGGFDA